MLAHIGKPYQTHFLIVYIVKHVLRGAKLFDKSEKNKRTKILKETLKTRTQE